MDDVNKEIIISSKGIIKRFGKKRVLKGIDLDVYKNERIAIVGGNGAGKTTLLNILSKNDHKFTGKLKIGVKPSEMSFQFQTLNYPNELSLVNLLNVFTVKVKGEKRKERIEAELKSVDLWEHRKRFPSELSGGQLQKFNLLMTMATNPKLIFFDEILSGLDQPSISTLISYIKKNIHNKSTTITISHNPQEIFELCERVIILKDGQIETDVPISEFKNAKELEDLMKESILLENEIDYDKLMITPKAYEHISIDDPSVYVNGVKKWYDLHDVLLGEDGKGINTNFKAGESVAVIGRNGSGKSTLAEIIAGVKKASKGKVDIDIFDANSKIYHNFKNELTRYKFSRRVVSLEERKDRMVVSLEEKGVSQSKIDKKVKSFEKRRLSKVSKKEKKRILSIVRKNININKKPSASIAAIQFQKQLYPSMLSLRDVIVYNLQMAKVDFDEYYIDFVLESIGLVANKYSSTHSLSGGQRQKLNIILALIKKPAILILDELTTGLDLLAQEKLLRLIKKYIEIEKPITIVVTHSMEDIKTLANRLIWIDDKKISLDQPYDNSMEKEVETLLNSLDAPIE